MEKPCINKVILSYLILSYLIFWYREDTPGDSDPPPIAHYGENLLAPLLPLPAFLGCPLTVREAIIIFWQEAVPSIATEQPSTNFPSIALV